MRGNRLPSSTAYSRVTEKMEPDPSQGCTEKGHEDKRTSHKLQEEEFKVHIKETSLSES